MLLSYRYSSDKYLLFENRFTEEKPMPSRENILSGEYFKLMDNYLSDNFIGRTSLLKSGTAINLNLLKRPLVNDLYIEDDVILDNMGYFDYKFPQEELDSTVRACGSLNEELRKRGADFYYVGIPEHTSIYSYKYPDHFFSLVEEWIQLENSFFKGLDELEIKNLKMRDFLKEDVGSFYNATDHHYSFRGAIKTYEELLNLINRDTDLKLSSDGLSLIELDHNLKGSYSRKLFNLDNYKDKAIIYDVDFDFTREDYEGLVESKLFYLDKTFDDSSYTYDIYMGGDQPSTKIDTNRPELPNILVYGNSFTNPLETLLARNANKLWSFDFRFYLDKNLLELVDELKPDLVICIIDDLNYLNKENNGQLLNLGQ